MKFVATDMQINERFFEIELSCAKFFFVCVLLRFATMHLKPYPKPQDKEKHQESVHDETRGLLADQQGVLGKEWGVRQACSLMSSPGNGTANRCPLSIISTNTLRSSTNSGSNTPTRVSGTRKTKASPVTTFTSSVVLLSSSNGLENEDSLRIYQGEDAEGSLDIWAVIKPGNTKEKVALFAAQRCGSTCDGGIDSTSEHEAIAPELRNVSLKNKSCWEGDWCVAKRRRRSGNPEMPKSVESPAPKADTQRITQSEVPSENINPCQVMSEEEEAEKTISVVEMVAYLEQRANDQQVSSKSPSLRSTSTITLSKAIQQSKDSVQPEIQDEEGEFVRVLDMVAKLESQCLSRQGIREGGDLSRNNSLRRKVGRVLLAGSEPYSLLSHSVSSTAPQERTVHSEPQELGSVSDKLTTPSLELATTEGSNCSLATTALHHEDGSWMAGPQCIPDVEIVESSPRHASLCGSEEPQPGMLFFARPLKDQHKSSSPENTPQNKELNDGKPSVETLLSFREDFRDGHDAEQNNNDIETETTSVVSRESVPFLLRRLVSHEFLETRFKIKLLLEPQQYMFFLPHHIIIKIFCLLPTESLAALKCTCHYFKFIIERYGVRPADSRWVSDPRYKDDPCKQCKKRYDRGDVSLCRWHHKPYCQALPYGPGYWMCCRGAHKDTLGCNVGLHDNRWVPAFHNMPIYKKSRDTDED